MQFEVLGQPYFLQYIDDEGRWFLFRPGPRGIEQIPVEEDSAQPMFGGVIMPLGEEGKTTIN